MFTTNILSLKKSMVMIYLLSLLSLVVLEFPPNWIEANQELKAEIEFEFLSKGVQGSISGFQFTGEIDPEALEDAKFSGYVTVETLSTGNFLRDWHLKTKKYFDSDQYPFIKFKSTEVIYSQDNITVIGLLTIKDITKSMQWEFKKNNGNLEGVGKVNTYDYGIAIKKQREENEVNVGIRLLQ